MPLTKDKMQIIKAMGHIEAARICIKAMSHRGGVEDEVREGFKFLNSAIVLLNKIVVAEDLDEIIRRGKIN